MPIFNNAFEELNHDNKNQQTEVHNDDRSDTDAAVNVKRPSKASRNFAKPVSYKDITEAMQKAVQSIEGTKRQCCEVLQNEIILSEVLHKCFSLPESVGSKCLRGWGLRSKLGV